MLDVIVEILGLFAYATGKIILYAVSGGRYKPNSCTGSANELRSALCTCIGIIFWGAVLVMVAWITSRISR
jgi:hypothetical protein